MWLSYAEQVTDSCKDSLQRLAHATKVCLKLHSKSGAFLRIFVVISFQQSQQSKKLLVEAQRLWKS